MSGGAELREDLLAAAAEEEDTEHSWQSDSSVDVASAQRLAERLRQSDTALPEESKAGGRKAKQTWTFSSSGWVCQSLMVVPEFKGACCCTSCCLPCKGIPM